MENTVDIPDEIKNIFDNGDDDCSINITKAEVLDDKDLSIEFVLNDPTNGNHYQWKLIASDYKKSKTILADSSEFIDIFIESPLLWEFTDIQSELYYSGEIIEPKKLLYELFLIHESLFNGYVSFELFPRELKSNLNQFQYKNGLLAKGSRKLLELYAKHLRSVDIGYSIIGERVPTYWNGVKHAEEKDLKLLLIGESYVIAQDFSFEKIEGSKQYNSISVY